jgi:hypothetical protein
MNTQMKTLMYQRIFNSDSCRILLATFLSALCLIALRTQAATITVTNTNDSGAGSLRQALADANDGDTIHFGITGTITMTTGEMLVDKSVTISGPGAASLTVDGNAADRVFHVSSGVTAAIAGLTITNGYDGMGGGGIYSDHADLTLSNCAVSGNSCAGGGGGVWSDGSDSGSATLTLNNCTFSGNAADAGGGVWSDGSFGGSATMTLNNGTFSGNAALYSGGGVFSDGFSGSATLTVNNSTFSGNSNSYLGALGVGGGIWNYGNSGSATLTVNNSTFSGNSAYLGGGIYNDGYDGGSATLDLTATILNIGDSGENIYNFQGIVTSHGYNLSSDNGGDLLTATGDQINTDPMLGPLQDNGGPTFTHAPLTGSPAIDAGKNFTARTTDQRGAGFVRTFDDASIANANDGDGTDIGAFEVQGPPSQYAASIQQPINADGTSVFNGRRGVVPVKFTLTLGGVATCTLPPATIAVTRTAGGVIGPIDEADYTGSADNGSNFRIANCQYAYNLSTGALGAGTYRGDIIINGQVVGSATFGLR